MIENLTSTTFSSVTAGLGGITLFSLSRALTSDSQKKKLSNSIAVLINCIAFIHYYKMRNMYDVGNVNDLVQIRYSDWFITCPLLLIEFFILLEFIQINNNKINIDSKYSNQIIISLITTLLMLIFGYLSETMPKYKWTFYSLGFLSLIILIVVLLNMNNKQSKETKNKLPKYPWFFIIIWILYGLVYILPNRDLFYNILDLISKGVFAFFISVL